MPPPYGQRESLRTFIKKQIVTGDKEDTLLKIEHGKIKPSKQLQDALVNMLKGNQEFVMLDDQKVVYESILDYSCQCQKDGKKRTIIVEGGPGTGKTVVAINLLAELTNRMQFVQYVSKNAAPRTVYQISRNAYKMIIFAHSKCKRYENRKIQGVYETSTKPLIDYYKVSGRYYEIDGVEAGILRIKLLLPDSIKINSIQKVRNGCWVYLVDDEIGRAHV